MNPALWAAKTGLDAQQTRLAVTSNNLANVSTSGFKKSRAVFEDLLYQNVRQVGASTSQDTQAPSGVHLGTGVRVVATEKIYTQGGLTQTGNALDVAIEGRGFFQIQMPDGTTTLHARWQLPVVGAGTDGDLERLRAAAGHQHSRWLAEHHHRPRRRRHACASPASRTRCRSASSSSRTS